MRTGPGVGKDPGTDPARPDRGWAGTAVPTVAASRSGSTRPLTDESLRPPPPASRQLLIGARRTSPPGIPGPGATGFRPPADARPRWQAMATGITASDCPARRTQGPERRPFRLWQYHRRQCGPAAPACPDRPGCAGRPEPMPWSENPRRSRPWSPRPRRHCPPAVTIPAAGSDPMRSPAEPARSRSTGAWAALGDTAAIRRSPPPDRADRGARGARGARPPSVR